VTRLKLLLLVLALGVLPDRVLAQDIELPSAPDSLATARNAIVLVLPQSGGYAINHQVVPLSELGQQFRAIYDSRPIKILLVSWGDNRPWKEVETVVLLAQEEGIMVYRIPLRSGDI
jgi:hypothetical protein